MFGDGRFRMAVHSSTNTYIPVRIRTSVDRLDAGRWAVLRNHDTALMGRRFTVIRAQFARVQPRPLLVVLAAVFAGLSVVLVVAAAVTTTPLVLLAAVPLAMTALLMWYQGTGRLTPGAFGRRGRRRGRRGRRHVTRSTAGGTSRSGHRQEWEGGERRRTTFREEAAREARYRARRQARRHARQEADGGGGAGTASAWTNRRERADQLGGLTRAEAYDVLGLDPTATDAAVRDAYREKAKRAHPDTAGGSAESFQQLNDAYERLLED